MNSKPLVAALAASAGLLWAAAHAADERPAQAAPEVPPGIIIFELQPAEPGVAPPEAQPPQAAQSGSAQAQEQAILSMLLLQLLSGMGGHGSAGDGGAVEAQQLPPDAQRI